jgi:hypothetical protein
MFASVHCCTGNLALEVSDLKFFGILPTASLYLGTRTMVVKETIRINPWQESAASNRILAELEPLSSDVRRSPFIIHRSAFTVYRLPFTVHRSAFTIRRQGDKRSVSRTKSKSNSVLNIATHGSHTLVYRPRNAPTECPDWAGAG